MRDEFLSQVEEQVCQVHIQIPVVMAMVMIKRIRSQIQALDVSDLGASQ